MEVYATSDEAESRNDYIATYDGGPISAGSHQVVGTCVIRVSDKLTAGQQQAITESITESLIRL